MLNTNLQRCQNITYYVGKILHTSKLFFLCNVPTTINITKANFFTVTSSNKVTTSRHHMCAFLRHPKTPNNIFKFKFGTNNCIFHIPRF